MIKFYYIQSLLFLLLILSACGDASKSLPSPLSSPLPLPLLKIEKTKLDEFIQLKMFTLDNGLKVYFSKNDIDKSFQANIIVKVGSKDDPESDTGLAHYLEHLMFKGTENIGALDYAKEKVLNEQVEQLYEQKRGANEAQKREIQERINTLSLAAGKYYISGELSKMYLSLGAKNLNATTAKDYTIYKVALPSNYLAHWAKIESERFSSPVLSRGFQWELEVVYEEKNINMDRQFTDGIEFLNLSLFQNHPYGEQSGLGSITHLKNPSIKNIKEFYNKFYNPSNMAIVISGNLEYENVKRYITKSFGRLVNKKTAIVSESKAVFPLTENKVKIIKDRRFDNKLRLAYQLPGRKTEDYYSLMLFNHIIDDDKFPFMVETNQIRSGGSLTKFYRDGGAIILSASLKSGQKFKEVEVLLKQQIEGLCLGDLPQEKLDRNITSLSSEMEGRLVENFDRAKLISDLFVYDLSWDSYQFLFEYINSITRNDIVKVCKKYFLKKYVVVKEKNEHKETTFNGMVKPQITPFQDYNESDQSLFFQELMTLDIPQLEAEFLYGDDDLIVKKY